MEKRSNDYEVGEALLVVSTWTVGVAIVVMALFPFAIPFLILLLAAGLPLVLLALPVAALAAIWIGARAVVRRVRGLRRDRPSRPSPAPSRTHPSPRPAVPSTPSGGWRRP